jgi:hypothetical protein
MAQARANESRNELSAINSGKTHSCMANNTAMLTTVPDAPTVANLM